MELTIRGVGVALDRFAPGEVPGVDAITDPARPLVVLPARLLREKGVQEFAEAARRLIAAGHAAEFAIAGSPDPENPSLFSAAEISALEKDYGVHALGHVEDIAGLLSRASIVCLPSYREGMPKALAEAAASGKPIVTTDVPGCRETVVHGVNGFLVPAKDAHALADAIEALLRDPELRRAMGVASRALAEERFGERALIARTLELYA